MSTVNLTIDGKKVEVPPGTTILEAAKSANLRIPTLCYLPEVQAIGACRVCLVEIEGNKNLQASCVFPATDDLVVRTNSKKVQEARKFTVELLLSAHPQECLTCARNLKCELQRLAEEMGIREVRSVPAVRDGLPGDSAGRGAVCAGTRVRYLHRAGLRG